MNITPENRYIRAVGNAIQGEAHFHMPRPPRGQRMDLRCPNCNSLDLKKVSLAYQEGVYRVDTRTRLRAFLFGSEGPNVIIGKAVTQGVHETQLSERLRPPMKWSYLKLIGWSVVVSLVTLIVYVHSVMGSSTKVSSLPAMVGMFVVATGFLFLFFVFWRHNHLVYPRQYAEWDTSWVCQRCGGISSQRVD
jgi:hypothetical protein